MISRNAKLQVLLFLLLLGLSLNAFAEAELCLYQSDSGKIEQAQGLKRVPQRYRKQARCLKPAQQQMLARPDEIDLKGNVRRESMASSLGRIELRWPRKSEILFGRTPQRAMAEAASAASRAVKRAGFPQHVRSMSPDWQVVFMDEELPEKQIPAYLISNCHPAWMVPEANLYIVAQRVAAGCGGSRASTTVADSELARVLLHEIGHAVEYQLLQGSIAQERMLAEGFASWFEQYAADFAPVIGKGKARSDYLAMAKQSFRESPENFDFHGSAFDYARASMFFRVVEEKRGIPALMSIYEAMRKERVGFFSAAERALGWDRARFDAEISRLLT